MPWILALLSNLCHLISKVLGPKLNVALTLVPGTQVYSQFCLWRNTSVYASTHSCRALPGTVRTGQQNVVSYTVRLYTSECIESYMHRSYDAVPATARYVHTWYQVHYKRAVHSAWILIKHSKYWEMWQNAYFCRSYALVPGTVFHSKQSLQVTATVPGSTTHDHMVHTVVPATMICSE